MTHLGFRQYSESLRGHQDPRGKDYYWITGHYRGHLPFASSDCQCISEGFISFTLISHFDQASQQELGLENKNKEKIIQLHQLIESFSREYFTHYR